MHETNQNSDPDLSNPQKVFVVFGRNRAAYQALLTFLRAIGLEPVEWDDAVAATGKAAPFIGEIVEAGFSQAQAVVVLLTGDDQARLHKSYIKKDEDHEERQLLPQPRANVLFEAGRAFGTHQDRTILVHLGPIRPFSDIEGRHLINLDDSEKARKKLITALKNAGCNIREDSDEWKTAGNFKHAILPPFVDIKKWLLAVALVTLVVFIGWRESTRPLPDPILRIKPTMLECGPGCETDYAIRDTTFWLRPYLRHYESTAHSVLKMRTKPFEHATTAFSLSVTSNIGDSLNIAPNISGIAFRVHPDSNYSFPALFPLARLTSNSNHIISVPECEKGDYLLLIFRTSPLDDLSFGFDKKNLLTLKVTP